MMLLGGVMGLWGMGQMLYDQLGMVMEQAFLFERRHAMESTPMLVNALDLGQRTLIAMLPLFLLLTVIALVAPALLGGWLISSKSLQPKFSKLNPVKGLKGYFLFRPLLSWLRRLLSPSWWAVWQLAFYILILANLWG
ncbi:hypothetical protein HAALTHF_07360n [Vreelandella aquamarina]|nr:hypothetical protein HAALTHF_07360n [Halomonas axialensis]